MKTGWCVIRKYDKKFKEEAVKLSDEVGIKQAAAQLGVAYYTLSEWRQKRKAYGDHALFTALREEKALLSGKYTAKTAAGKIPVTIEPGCIWMGMAPGKIIKVLSDEEASAPYQAYGLCIDDKPATFQPCIVSTGLPDILLPVDSIDKTHTLCSKQRRGHPAFSKTSSGWYSYVLS